ncbi:MAG: LAGLIDADG family homing endonuclease [Candidatus Buchananbacteria bacterium]|jgi:intein/homing endonuclease
MINWHYIAGFFDGEGSITYNGKGYRVTISQTNKEVLDQIRDFSGIGGVIAVTKRKKHWKQSWVYYVAKQKDVDIFLKKIRNKVLVKRSLTIITLNKLKKYLADKDIMEKKRSNIRNTAKKLRNQGYTYRGIGRKLNIDFGYARRIILK